MRLICPNCQKPVTVPDSDAGKSTKCPECGQSFPAPELYSMAAPDLPPPDHLPQMLRRPGRFEPSAGEVARRAYPGVSRRHAGALCGGHPPAATMPIVHMSAICRFGSVAKSRDKMEPWMVASGGGAKLEPAAPCPQPSPAKHPTKNHFKTHKV